MSLSINVNGVTHSCAADDADRSLLDLLREELGLTGAKRGCGEGACGACTVLLGSRAAQACQLSVADAAQKFLSLYERAADPNLDHAIVDAEISRFNDLSIDQLKALAKEVNQPLPPGLKKKPEFVAIFKRMIKEPKANGEHHAPASSEGTPEVVGQPSA